MAKLDYLNGVVGLEHMIPKTKTAYEEEAEQTTAALEALSMDDVASILDDMSVGFENVFIEKDSYYDLVAYENRMDKAKEMGDEGLESAYIQNRSLIKSAFIRFKMLFKLDKEKAMVEYAEIIRNIDPTVIQRGYQDLIFDKKSIIAYDKLMHLANELSDGMDEGSIKRILNELGDKLFKRYRNILLTVIGAYIPLVNLLALAYLIYIIIVMPGEAEELNREYGADIKKEVTKAISKTALAKEVGLKIGPDGNYDVASLMKFVGRINILKSELMPMTHRYRESLPDLFKKKKSVSYEDRVEMVNLIKENADLYLDTLGSSPAKMANAIRFILASEELVQGAAYGDTFGLASDDTVYSALGSSLYMAYLDILTATFMLVRDLKRY